jgi:Fe2+ transport system protein FeoA
LKTAVRNRTTSTELANSEQFSPICVIINTGTYSPIKLHADQNLSALSELRVGATAVVESLDLPDEIGHHLMHMGFAPEARVVVVRRAPAGDPTVYSIDGFEIALRRETARFIRVNPQPEGPQ